MFKSFFQKLLRSHHSSDSDLSDLNYHLAKLILPKLKAFRKLEFYTYPTEFEEYSDNGRWRHKQEYRDAQRQGEIIGGGIKKWLETIDEMIFAFEYILVEYGNHPKLEKEFKKKYGDWTKISPQVKCKLKVYQMKNGGLSMNEKSGSLKHLYEFYYDSELHSNIIKRHQNGLKLFGRFFQSLCD